MIVDIVEAKIRSIKATTPDADIASLIKGDMGQLTEETNLDELTIKQGRIITETLMTEYNVADHKRDSYESK
jgi:membrane-associated HD superfamily phosphohydrolase